MFVESPMVYNWSREGWITEWRTSSSHKTNTAMGMNLGCMPFLTGTLGGRLRHTCNFICLRRSLLKYSVAAYLQLHLFEEILVKLLKFMFLLARCTETAVKINLALWDLG
ncbi:hypothetical protein MLD38_010360 [Melastoma candidum]|uniref:Uncharacterized protein n=1 Tax=Melastoma candidum TaxID=119954 RepID=A0ACB9R3P0_9MYRT|nr:hypothetical protein MLD38_010360 [Melastoma candidum]